MSKEILTKETVTLWTGFKYLNLGEQREKIAKFVQE
jgi:hypothetical protein